MYSKEKRNARVPRDSSNTKADVKARESERGEQLKSEIIRFYVVEAGICARYSRAKPPREFWHTKEDFINHARVLFLGSIAYGEEKGGRAGGGE